MKISIIYKEEGGWFVGHVQEYPDYESQGETLDELKENLLDIYHRYSWKLNPLNFSLLLIFSLINIPFKNKALQSFQIITAISN
jgi:hypothetical protein